jgi:hypothetical protein
MRWGVYQPFSEPEPNNKFPPENCAAANFSQISGGLAGWSDTSCFSSFPFMCKIPGGPLRRAYPNPRLALRCGAKTISAPGRRLVCTHLLLSTQLQAPKCTSTFPTPPTPPTCSTPTPPPALLPRRGAPRRVATWRRMRCRRSRWRWSRWAPGQALHQRRVLGACVLRAAEGARLPHACDCLPHPTRPAPTPTHPTPSQPPTPQMHPHPHPPQYFMGAGYLLPTFHKQYYIGLRVAERPWFRWTEPYYELSQESYQHWGAEGSSQEPNNRFPPEDCGAATAAQSFGDAWGWSDVNCTRRLVFVCKILREWRLRNRGVSASTEQPLANSWTGRVCGSVVKPGMGRTDGTFRCCSRWPGAAAPLQGRQLYQRHLRAHHHAQGASRRPGGVQCALRPPGGLREPGGAGRGGELVHVRGGALRPTAAPPPRRDCLPA